MAFDCIQVRRREPSAKAVSELALRPSYRESLLLEPISPPPNQRMDCKSSLMALHDNYDKYLNSLPQKQKEYHHLVMAARKSANYPLNKLSAPLLLAKQQRTLIENQYLRQQPSVWSQPQIQSRPEPHFYAQSPQKPSLKYASHPAFGQPINTISSVNSVPTTTTMQRNVQRMAPMYSGPTVSHPLLSSTLVSHSVRSSPHAGHSVGSSRGNGLPLSQQSFGSQSLSHSLKHQPIRQSLAQPLSQPLNQPLNQSLKTSFAQPMPLLSHNVSHSVQSLIQPRSAPNLMNPINASMSSSLQSSLQSIQNPNQMRRMCAHCTDHCLPQTCVQRTLNDLNSSLQRNEKWSPMTQRSVIMRPTPHQIPEMPSFPSIQKKRKSPQTVRQILSDSRVESRPLFQQTSPHSQPQSRPLPKPRPKPYQTFVTPIDVKNNHLVKSRLIDGRALEWASRAVVDAEMPLNLKTTTTQITVSEDDDDIQVLSHFRRDSEESQRDLSRNSSLSSDSIKLRISETPPPLERQKEILNPIIESIVESIDTNEERIGDKSELRIDEKIEHKNNETIDERMEERNEEKIVLEAIEDKSEEKCEEISEEMNQKSTPIRESTPEEREESEEEFERRLQQILDLLVTHKDVGEGGLGAPPKLTPESSVGSEQTIDSRFCGEKQDFVRTLDLIRVRDLKRKPIAYLNARHPLNDISRSIYAGVATKKSVLDFPSVQPTDDCSAIATKRKRFSLWSSSAANRGKTANDWRFVLSHLDFSSPLSQRVVGVLPHFQFR